MDKNNKERLEQSKNIDIYFDDIFNNITTYTKKLKLLYVEDNQESRESSILILEEFFDNIIIAVDGADGYDKFINNEIDIIISDINMPKMDGLLMFEKIREIDKEVYLILLTAHNEIEYYERSMILNIEGYLLKPIGLAPFLSILDKVALQIKLKDEINANVNLLKQYQNAMDQNLIISKTNLDGNIIYVNNKFIQTYGYEEDEVIGKQHNILKSEMNDPQVFEDIWNTIATKKQTWTGVIGNKTKDNKISYSKTTISPILDINNNPIEYIALRQDVTELIEI